MTFLEATAWSQTGKMAGEGRILAVNALLLSLASRPLTFQCRGFLLSLLMLQLLRQRQYIVTRADPGWVGYSVSQIGQHASAGYLAYHVNAKLKK